VKQGILLVDKPEDWTSFDVVNYVRRIVANKEGLKPKQIKLGHSGTLDPFATGLLILLVGKDYTRRASEFSKQDKTYSFELILGKSSNSGDKTGQITDVSSEQPTIDKIDMAVAKFTGEISQTPPAFSAIKINGVRAYKLARAGVETKIEPRKVNVSSLQIIDYNYPQLTLKADVSSGTYIRSLGEDLGKELGVGAYTNVLRRESVGSYSIDAAVSPKDLNTDNIEQFISTI
jgi:tRNA pseudouridine55 synthase